MGVLDPGTGLEDPDPSLLGSELDAKLYGPAPEIAASR
jgi:hypothetical protein